jgi:hypothetical protein
MKSFLPCTIIVLQVQDGVYKGKLIYIYQSPLESLYCRTINKGNNELWIANNLQKN